MNTIVIGKATRKGFWLWKRIEIEQLELDIHTPNGGLVRKNNHITASAADWQAFIDDAGLANLFFHPTTGLMRRQPGVSGLDKTDLQIIKSARIMYQRTHPHARPVFHATDEDATFAFLNWLEFWVSYALTRPNPAIQNW